MVEPERDMPGVIAMPCITPMNKASHTVMVDQVLFLILLISTFQCARMPPVIKSDAYHQKQLESFSNTGCKQYPSAHNYTY